MAIYLDLLLFTAVPIKHYTGKIWRSRLLYTVCKIHTHEYSEFPILHLVPFLSFLNADSPDIDITSRRRQSVAEILAAAQSDKEMSGVVTISPLVSPLKITYSSPPSSDIAPTLQEEEVYESDVKFAGITPMHVAASR